VSLPTASAAEEAPAAGTKTGAGIALYAVTIFLSAFLLFQIQPLIAKMILPWFGGTASVWTTCLLFFQTALLAGYLYAHWLTQRMAGRTQALAHAGLLIASLLLLPVVPGAHWKPLGGEDPMWRILGLLTASVGLPYFLLASTGPLLQNWYVVSRHGAFPYRLYALSNLASMLALLSYPVLVEPRADTRIQAGWWSAAYGIFVALTLVLALRRRRMANGEVEPVDEAAPRPEAAVRILWIALPASASWLLLAITNHLTQNIASIPFLWVLPLSLYLLSFIITFDHERWYHRGFFLRLLAVMLAAMAYTLIGDTQHTDLRLLIPVFSTGLFTICMCCHGELARLKPHPRYLTAYYLRIALGGALGGAAVGMAAPYFFSGYYELAGGLGLCALAILAVLYLVPGTPLYRGGEKLGWVSLLVLFAALCYTLAKGVYDTTSEYRVRLRSFYGALRVIDDSGTEDITRKLLHGTINHGQQFLSGARSRNATTYYGPRTGIGIALQNSGHTPQRVGVVGLGAGTLASYGRKGDYYRFYDINPQVVRLANTEFRFLRESQAKVEIALGDARLSLEREAPEQFDVLALDAFSSDAIPVHLITREAFQVYFRHVKPDGIVAAHISNRYVDLAPVIAASASALGKKAWFIDSDDDDENGVFGATWILISGRPGLFELPAFHANGSPVEPRAGLRPWTDDYSNLLQLVKWRDMHK
jgi:SAM-dependent methyltransferase